MHHHESRILLFDGVCNYISNICMSSNSIIQSMLSLFRFKQRMKMKMIHNRFNQEPANPTESLRRKFDVREHNLRNRKVWFIAPIVNQSNLVVIFFHGGAYMGNVTKNHWNLIEQLITRTNATFVVPDYPLAPLATYKETYAFVDDLYEDLIKTNADKQFILSGDSSGGGLALGFALKLKNEHQKQPVHVMLFSAWLDISMSNPAIQSYDKQDKILSIEGLKSAAQKYAGNLDQHAYLVSPIYGDFAGMCKISVFIGTNDLLYADNLKLRQILEEQNLPFNYFEYPEMFHDWIIITGLKESQHAINQAAEIINVAI